MLIYSCDGCWCTSSCMYGQFAVESELYFLFWIGHGSFDHEALVQFGAAGYLIKLSLRLLCQLVHSCSVQVLLVSNIQLP